MSSPMHPALASFAATVLGLATGVAAFVRTTWRAHVNRRAVNELLSFDDRALADIGITRADVAAVLSTQLFDDPSTRLRILAVERRAARRAQRREWIRDEAGPTAPAAAVPAVRTPV